jgi:hypothetical protein
MLVSSRPAIWARPASIAITEHRPRTIPSFGDHIGHVFGMSSEPQVSRVHASSDIATMSNF